MRNALIRDGLRTSGGFALLFVMIAATALLMSGGTALFFLGYGIMGVLYCAGVALVAMKYDRRPGVPIPRGAVLVASGMFLPMLVWPVLGSVWYQAIAGDRVEAVVESSTAAWDRGSTTNVLEVRVAGVGLVQPWCGEAPDEGDRVVVWSDPGGWAKPASPTCAGYALTSGTAAAIYVLMAGVAVRLRLSTLARGDAPQGLLRLGSTIGPLAHWARRRS
ncbi:hypothetical protein J2S43_003257 [Catenuloplanes nepalensis]|uniref:Uncharacterized protein n=1 Tax=Catenuloplanes nepalensis TaxID=587533 RepID=A0ABT9MTL1_9ACTN|nr:hypothetical protein [Catenuloplanes nepalensis]MDP9794745.1 hypothetical protein [Catenuloplanes nepalensis]